MTDEEKINMYISLEYQKRIKEGLKFDISMLTNDIEKNEKIIRSLCACFTGMFYIISSDISLIPYFYEQNEYLTNLSIRHTSGRVDILNDNNIELSNKLVLISVIDLIAVYMYINKETFLNQENYLDIFINKIKDNFEIYEDYFIDNNIFDLESPLGPISSGGFINEFIVIGNIVKDIYNKKNKQYKKV